MNTVKKEGFHLIGIKVRTSNATGQAANDIGMLWQKFMAENIAEKIPNRLDHELLCVYTNYEGDHNKPYDAVIGCRVSNADEVPNDMVAIEVEGGDYEKFTTSGNLSDGIIYNKWLEIWKEDLHRLYAADYEVFGEKAQDPTNAEIDIYIGVE